MSKRLWYERTSCLPIIDMEAEDGYGEWDEPIDEQAALQAAWDELQATPVEEKDKEDRVS